MIRVEYSPYWAQLRLHGHAQYAPEGQDIVCAGVSALYETLLGHPQVHEESRDGWSILTADEGAREEMRPLFELIARGLERIADQYPAHVRFWMQFVKPE